MEPLNPIERFSGRRYINLESYKKDGTPVLTPVQSMDHDGLVYFRTDPTTWKVKRIRRNPHVRIVPSDRNGKPAGTWVDGVARVVEGEERDRMEERFRKEYGSVGNLVVGLVARMRGEKLTTIISVDLTPRDHSEAGRS